MSNSKGFIVFGLNVSDCGSVEPLVFNIIYDTREEAEKVIQEALDDEYEGLLEDIDEKYIYRGEGKIYVQASAFTVEYYVSELF